MFSNFNFCSHFFLKKAYARQSQELKYEFIYVNHKLVAALFVLRVNLFDFWKWIYFLTADRNRGYLWKSSTILFSSWRSCVCFPFFFLIESFNIFFHSFVLFFYIIITSILSPFFSVILIYIPIQIGAYKRHDWRNLWSEFEFFHKSNICIRLKGRRKGFTSYHARRFFSSLHRASI